MRFAHPTSLPTRHGLMIEENEDLAQAAAPQLLVQADPGRGALGAEVVARQVHPDLLQVLQAPHGRGQGHGAGPADGVVRQTQIQLPQLLQMPQRRRRQLPSACVVNVLIVEVQLQLGEVAVVREVRSHGGEDPDVFVDLLLDLPFHDHILVLQSQFEPLSKPRRCLQGEGRGKMAEICKKSPGCLGKPRFQMAKGLSPRHWTINSRDSGTFQVQGFIRAKF